MEHWCADLEARGYCTCNPPTPFDQIRRLTRERDEARADVYELKKDVEIKRIVIEHRTEAIDNLIDELNEARAWAKSWKKAAKMWKINSDHYEDCLFNK